MFLSKWQLFQPLAALQLRSNEADSFWSRFDFRQRKKTGASAQKEDPGWAKQRSWKNAGDEWASKKRKCIVSVHSGTLLLRDA
jgi:hypothetical protein